VATITKTYTDGDGAALPGTVTFTPYTVAAGRAVKGSPVVATVNPSTGAMSQALTSGSIYAVREDVKMRSVRQTVIVVGSSNGTLDAQDHYPGVIEAHLFTAGGEDGAGVPAGGGDGQILAKASAADYDTEWITPA
jgi:hypothetical protein